MRLPVMLRTSSTLQPRFRTQAIENQTELGAGGAYPAPLASRKGFTGPTLLPNSKTRSEDGGDEGRKLRAHRRYSRVQMPGG
jgi:hypothetical protein